MEGCVVVNVRFNLDTGESPTILKVPYDIFWQDFELLLKLNFDCADITVKYLDEDLDYILISSDQELFEAFRHAKCSDDVLELSVSDAPQRNQKVVSSKPATDIDSRGVAGPVDLDPEVAVAMIDRVVEDNSSETPETAQTVQTKEQADEPSVEGAQMDCTEGHKEDEEPKETSVENPERISPDDTQETGERVYSRTFSREVKRRGARSKVRRAESCYTRCAQEMGEYRRCHSQPDDGKRNQRHLPRDQDSGESYAHDGPVSYNMLMEFLSKLKEDLRTEIVRDVTRKTVKQVLKGLDGAVIQSLQGSKCASSVPAGEAKQEMPLSGHPSYVHDGIICDNCNQTIVGVRYKCGNCADYDLCEACETQDGIHTPEHVFIKLRRPWAGVGKVEGEQVPLLRCLVYQPCEETWVPEGEEMLTEAQAHPRWERFKEKVARMQEKIKRKEEKRLEKFKRKEEKLKRRLEHERSLPVKREKLDIPQLLHRGRFGASFIEDVTIPDGTRVQPGTKMFKTWILRNTGTTRWTETTKLRMVWGSMTAAQTEVPVPLLAPAEQGPVTVELIAPTSTGRYQSHWKMHNNGVSFGHRVWCTVIVEPKEILEPTTEESLKVTQGQPMVQEHDEAGDNNNNTDLVEDGPVDMTIGRRGDRETELSLPLVPLQPAMNVPGVVSMATVEEAKGDRLGSDKVQEDLTTAAAVVAQLQLGQDLIQTPAPKGDNPNNDLLSYELVDVEKREMRDLSQTAAPNNTPSVLTPPKSPVAGGPRDRVLSNSSSVEMVADLGLDDEETTSTEMLDYVQERMASLGLRPDHDFELESLSSSTDDEESISSDGDFFIVPLPDCFLPDKPLTRSQLAEQNFTCDQNSNIAESTDLNSDKSVDEILTVSSSVDTPTLSPVSTATSGDQTAKEEQITIATQAGEASAAVTEVAVQEVVDMSSQSSQTEATATSDVGVAAESEEPVKAEDSGSTEAGATSTEGAATPTETEGSASENGAASTPSTKDVKGQQQAKAGEFANQLMSTAVTAATRAATHAYSTAKEVFLTWQAKHGEGQAAYVPPKSNWKPPANDYVPPKSTWTPPTDDFTPPQSQWTPPSQTEQPRSKVTTPMQQLMEMGFCNRELNTMLLDKYENDVEKAVQELLSGIDNDWAENRH
ncbi:next to BRCA1 gene 1 protein-like [Liolophura sinensis]|uniref:next to BRCA1 gene 1 protein-like n=1 Tax=Liolophura sinensis TaxID=3198878 RepID=UPI00315839CB